MSTSGPSDPRPGTRRPRRWRAGGLGMLVVVAGLSVAGCSSDGDQGPARRPVVIAGTVAARGPCPETRDARPEDCPATPLEGARVVLMDGDGATVATTASAADGSFTLDAEVPPGAYTVEATGPTPGATGGPATAAVEVTVAAGATEQRITAIELNLDTGIR